MGVSGGNRIFITSYGFKVEYIAPPFTYASAHAEPDTRAIVGKIGGSWSPFWGGVRRIVGVSGEA
eukprot:scaffold135711_cov77-Cyclotella_meneghiniana.AAC.2